MRLLSLPAFAVAVVVSDPGVDVSPKDEWSQFRGSTLRTGRSAAEVPDELRLLWSFEAGFSIDSSAAIVEGVVYMTALPGLVAALSLEDGTVRWKRDFGEEADRFGESSPTVADGVVYVGDLLGTLHAFRAADGETLWTFETGSEIKSSAVVAGDDVLISSYDEHLYSSTESRAPWGNSRHGAASQHPGSRTAHLRDRLRSLFQESVSPMEPRRFSSTPAPIPRRLCSSTESRTTERSTTTSSPSTEEQEVPLAIRAPGAPFPSTSAAVADGKVWSAAATSWSMPSIETGQSVWTFATGARVESSPVTAGNRVYVGSGDGRFYVLDLATGAKIWEFEAGASIVASPRPSLGTHRHRKPGRRSLRVRPLTLEWNDREAVWIATH
jgi:outer membrane protein assembly factor BamB